LGGSRTPRYDIHSVVCQTATLQTPSVSAEGAGVEPARQYACSTGFQPAPVAARVALPPFSDPGWTRTSDLLHVTEMSCQLNDGTIRHSTPTRSRTRNVAFEARHDVRFTTGARVSHSGPTEN